MKVLVTGGGGFVGSHVAHRLVDDGHDVRVLDNFSTGHRANLRAVRSDVDLIEGDIQSYERTHVAARGSDVIYHFAALPSVPRSIQDPLTSHAVNSLGTLNVLLAARDAGVRRVVFASSSSVYGANPRLPKREEMRTAPISPYAVAKLAGEGFCRSFSEVYGLETVSLRLFNVFGPRQDPDSQYSAVIPRFLTALLAGASPVVFGDGSQSRDFTHVDNVVDACLRAAVVADADGTPLNIACGVRVTLGELIETMREVTGATAEVEYAPLRSGDVAHSQADIGLARSLLGYEPVIDLQTGLERTVEYYRAKVEASA